MLREGAPLRGIVDTSLGFWTSQKISEAHQEVFPACIQRSFKVSKTSFPNPERSLVWIVRSISRPCQEGLALINKVVLDTSCACCSAIKGGMFGTNWPYPKTLLKSV